MTDNKIMNQKKQTLTESASGINRSNFRIVQESMRNISTGISVYVQNSAGGIKSCAPVSTTVQPGTRSLGGIGSCSPNSTPSQASPTTAQSGSIGACAPKTGNNK